ncbi:MAG: M23 family metallopeptidase [Clostridia bacterium]|nr:M23 family metallopeptidase [Clostridia bacterium]
MQRYQREPVVAPQPKKKKSRTSARKKKAFRILVAVGMILLLLIPSYLAIGSYIIVKNAPKPSTETYYTSLDIVGPNGSLVSASPTTNADIFQCFTDMLNAPNPVSAIEPTHTAKYTVTMYTNTTPEQYTFHFSPAKNSVYFTKADGLIYHVTNTSGNLFLNSPLSYEVYPQASLPSLQAASTDMILPSTVDWHYRTMDGSFLQLHTPTVETEVKNYGIADNFVSFLFKNALNNTNFTPDDCQLIITRDNVKIFNSHIRVDDLSVPLDLPALHGDELFTIHAEYYQKSDVTYYGSLTYLFTMSSTEPAVFDIINTETVTAGSFYLFTAQNADRIDQLLFSVGAEQSTRAISPIVLKRGKTVYALIPTELADGADKLIVRYGSKMEAFALTHIPKTPFDASEMMDGYNLDLQSWIAQKGATQADADQNTSFISLVKPKQNQGELILPFGATITAGKSTISLPFELYRANGDATAPAQGIVKEVGTHTVLGGYVIVDHGCGIYSYYCGLSQTYVTVGHIVAVGDRLGQIGHNGIAPDRQNTLLFMMTIGKNAVDPAYLRNFNFQFGN